MDVKLFQTLDDGDIEVITGEIQMTAGYDTAIYLSLYGGNMGGTWWGDTFGKVENQKTPSETQALTGSIPLIPANLLRIRDAVKRDIAWMDKAPDVGVSMPAVNKVQITVGTEITILGGT